MSNKYLDAIYSKLGTGINYENDWNNYMLALGVKRHKDAIKILVYPGALVCAYYRVFIPFMELAKDPRYDIRISGLLSQRDDLDWADVVYLQRWVDRNAIEETKRIQKRGAKVIMDTDDYLHGLPEYHPEKRNVENSRYLPNMDEQASLCDAITVSTEYLAGLYLARWGRPIYHIKNCVRVEDYTKSDRNVFKSHNIYIGWAGGPSHAEDLKIVAPALMELFEGREGLRLLTINNHGVDRNGVDVFAGIPRSKRVQIVGCDPHLIYSYIPMIDIGLAPLIKNDFNRSKSNVKFLEYGLSGAFMIGTDLEPYQGEDSDCYSRVGSPNDWLGNIEDAVDKFREPVMDMIRKRAHQRVMSKYDIVNNIRDWKNLFEGVVNGRAKVQQEDATQGCDTDPINQMAG